MNYATIKPCDIANGIGVRVSLFVSGCRRHCKGCFNEEAQAFDYGEPFDQTVIDRILRDLSPSYISGITYLGGEPFEPENQPGLLELSRQIKAQYPNKTIWCFTGYVLEQDLLPGKLGDKEITDALLGYIDVLVDGPFVEAKRNLSLRFRGSENQRLIDLPATLQEGRVVLWNNDTI